MERIALLTDGIFPYVIGGMQKHSYYLAKYFAENGLIVDLYHTNKSQYDIGKLEFFSEKQRKNINSIIIQFPPTEKLPGHYIRESYKYSEAIFHEFKKQPKADFIYAKGFAGWKIIEEKKKGISFPKVGVNFHGYEMFQKQQGVKSRLSSSLFKKPVKFNIQNSDVVFSYGGKITRIIKQLGVNEKKIIEMPTGINPDWISQHVSEPAQTKRFIFVGRYEKRKGIDELNKVLSRIKDNQQFLFTFVGPIPESKQIKSEKIRYIGLISNESQMKEMLLQNDILVCPSHSEGMPNVILEAMASGLAIIASDVGAVSEMVSSLNGWLIKPASTEELENAMLSGIKSRSIEIKIKKEESLKLARENFNWNKLIIQTIAHIRQILSP